MSAFTVAGGQRLARLLPLCLLLLAGCAADYQAAGFGGGYSQRQLAPDLWRVTYDGGHANAETVQTYWLYRAAEFTLAQGYDGFELMSPIRLVDGPAGESRAPYRVAAAGSYVVTVVTPPTPNRELTADIRLLKQPFVPMPGQVFDAHTLQERLKPIVFGPKCTDNNVCPHPHWYLYKP
jgi:hypothetical protein